MADEASGTAPVARSNTSPCQWNAGNDASTPRHRGSVAAAAESSTSYHPISLRPAEYTRAPRHAASNWLPRHTPSTGRSRASAHWMRASSARTCGYHSDWYPAIHPHDPDADAPCPERVADGAGPFGGDVLDHDDLWRHHASAIPKAMWSAIAMMVIMGLTPLDVGNALPSAT